MKKTMCVVLALLLVVSSLAFAGGKAETAAAAADPNAR